MTPYRSIVHVLIFALLAARLVSAADPIVATDLLRLRGVSSIDVAKDGSVAVFAVDSIGRAVTEAGDAEEMLAEYSNQSHLYLLDLTDAESNVRRLTFGNRSDRSPVLSPDARHIAFVRRGKRSPDAKPQIWLLPTDGGEARQATSLANGAGSPRWSPDGRRLLVSSRIPIDELPGEPAWSAERPGRDWKDTNEDVTARPDGSRDEIRAWLDENANELDPNVMNRLEFQAEQSLKGVFSVRHLFLIDIDDESAEPRRITDGFADHNDAEFMPDGRSIVYASKGPASEHPDRIHKTGLRQIDITGENDRELLSLEDWTLSRPQPNRDGSVVAFLGKRMDDPGYRHRRLGISSITESGASEPVWLTEEETFDSTIWSFAWMPTRWALIFNTPMRGGFPLFTMSMGLLEPAAVVDEHNGAPAGVFRFAAGGGVIVYSLTTPTNPCVLRVRDARGDRLAFDLNEWVTEKDLAVPVEGWVTRPDGVEVQYWIMEPTNREPAKTYPLVLQIHGGPAYMYGPGEFSMWHEFQLLCSWGYAVVYANPRGSAGYGYEFERGTYQDWGGGPGGDVLAAVDQAMLNEWVDANRMVVTGGSYGGYLTAWIVAHDHRFKAAVAQRGVYDFATFFGEANAWTMIEETLGGDPWDPRIKPILTRESPFTYVNRIRTPLMIMHGSQDLRTGVSQSEMMYRALKQLGRPVEYVRYPGAGHGLSRRGKPGHRVDRLNRIIEFFERFVDNDRPAPQVGSEE